MKKQFSFFTFIFCVTSIAAYARAGGGHSGGGSSGGGGYGYGSGNVFFGFIAFVVVICGALIGYIVTMKSDRSKKLIAASEAADAFWNYDEMIALTNDVYLKMQAAWMAREIDLVKDIITESLYVDYRSRLDYLKQKHEINYVEGIEIKQVSIVGEEDHKDNEKDTYTAYVKGRMLDYTASDETNEIIENKDLEKSDFSDLYHFTRHENKWLLNKIDNNVNVAKIMLASQVIE